MNKTSGIKTQAIGRRNWIQDIGLLFKFRLSFFVVFSSAMAYVITAGASFGLLKFILLALGGFLITGAANALNQVFEREYDVLMERTKNRPIAAGRMSISEGVLIAGLSTLFGTLMLSLLGPLVGFIGLLSLSSYAFLYTPLKRYGTISVYVGAIPGALPVLIGCLVGEGSITAFGLLLFGIQFLWQLPHFWAIAMLGHDDYTRAGFKLLPTKENVINKNIGLHSGIYALAIIGLLLPAYFNEIIGLFGLVSVGLLTVWYAYKGFLLYKDVTKTIARRLMFASFLYLPLGLIFMLIDQLI